MENKKNKVIENTPEKKLNIGLFIDTWFPMIDGVISVVDNYAKRLKDYANVTVFTVASRDKKFVDNFPYRVVRCQQLNLPGLDYDLGMPGFDAKFQKELKESKLDIVHIHSPFSVGKAGVNYAKKHKIPCVATNHSQFKQDFFKATKSPALTDILLSNIMKVFNSCDENWSVNEKTAELFYEYGLHEMPNVMRNGTDFNSQEVDKYNIDIRAKYGINPNDKVLIFVGRMVDLKNIPFLIDAFNLVVKKDNSFKLILVGDGLRLDHYKKTVADLGIEKNVIFTGKVSDKITLGSLYKNCDLLVFPSYYDTDGLTKKEAGAFKKPTLVLENSFTSSDIVDCVNGYIAKNSIESFANKIFEIFDNKELYNTVCENALRDIYVYWDSIVRTAFERYKVLIYQKKMRNRAIAKKGQYTKTIKATQKKHQEIKQNNAKKAKKVREKAKKNKKTIKNIKKQKNTN